MHTNQDLHRQLRSRRARFYLADFHVHSPASADVRLSSRFEALSQEEKTLLSTIPEGRASNPAQYELEVINVYPPSTFLQSLAFQRDALMSGSDALGSDDWAIIAVTDHNICKYACELASYAWSNLAEYRIIILPGVELSVSYPVPPGNDRAAAHLLCIFAPKTNDSDIRLAITTASNSTWTFGEELSLESLSDFVYGLRNHSTYPSICIAAHVGSASGVQNETRKAILSRLDAAISRSEGELETGEQPNTEELTERLRQLRQEREEPDQISMEILSLIGRCGFDAIQVRGRHDEIHYRRLHRFREKFGRAVPIVCSDSHRIEDVFKTEGGVPHIKLSGLSTSLSPNQVFNSIRYALRLGETRFSYVSPDRPLYWVAGIQITPDAAKPARFWPFKNNQEGTHSFVLPFSRNLNCLIGGRGSGKSAALEALAFVSSPRDFDRFQRVRDDELPDWYSRSKATIEGCKLTICWQFLGYEQTQHLPKQAVFASRYFDPNARHESVVYSSTNGTELLSEQIPDQTIQYYRLGEIEQQAGPDKLRSLFDQICGKQIREHEKNIQEFLLKLESQRKEMVELARKIAKLTEEGSPLREYAQRKRLFDEVNLPEVRKAYEEVDRTEMAESVAEKAIQDWSAIQDEIDLPTIADKTSRFFEEIKESCTDVDGKIKPYHQDLVNLISSATEEGEATPAQKVSDALAVFDSEVKNVAQSLQTARHDIGTKGKTARDALAAQGLPTGGKDREAKKGAFDDSEEALRKYQQLLQDWEELNSARKTIVEALQEECQRRTNLRKETAISITSQLRRDLDFSVLVIEADAQPQMDTKAFWEWLDTHFSLKTFRFRTPRLLALIDKGLSPNTLRELLLQEGSADHTLLQIHRDRAEDGAIDETIAKMLIDHCIGRHRLDCDVDKSSVDSTFWDELPEEIRNGLITFPSEERTPQALKIDDVLRLDEIVYDDIPVIRLNDRPNDPLSKPQPIEHLSPGQRCSAILPILLLTGSSPLIIDQPEDNMDNRLIRQVIVNILSSIKLRRQVILATHNPNLPVLGDVEQAIILQGIGEHRCQIKAIGDLDSSDVVYHLTDVMEGGREAFQYRQTVYQTHWPGPLLNTPSHKG
jgi:DNA repair ATPase RecN